MRLNWIQRRVIRVGMTDWMLLLSCFVGGVMVLLIALGLGVAAVLPGIDRWSRRFFLTFFSVLLLCMGAMITDLVVYGNPTLVRVERIVTWMEYLLASVTMPMLTLYLLRCCGTGWRGSALFRSALILWVAYFLLLGIAQFTTAFYYVTPRNLFFRGPWHPLLMLPLVAILALNLAGVFRRRRTLSKKHFRAFLIYLLPITVAILIHIFVYVPLYINIGISICALTMFGVVLSDEIEQHQRQQREIAHQSASIMVLQMRPHFIYNTMTSIYYLCDQDPRKAKQVTLDFTTYLRRNFTAIASEETIPFSEELEHTRAYLAVEQTRFEGMLFVEYDTPHIALANIRQRLKLMCGGQLTIAPRKGGGTVVRMTIPG